MNTMTMNSKIFHKYFRPRTHLKTKKVNLRLNSMYKRCLSHNSLSQSPQIQKTLLQKKFTNVWKTILKLPKMTY